MIVRTVLAIVLALAAADPAVVKENRLTARILAGEKVYPHPPHSNQ